MAGRARRYLAGSILVLLPLAFSACGQSPHSGMTLPQSHAQQSGGAPCATPPVQAVQVTPSSLSVNVGASATFEACAQFAGDFSIAAVPSGIVSVASSATPSVDPNTGIKIATLTVTGVAGGSATITVTDKKGNTASVSVVVHGSQTFSYTGAAQTFNVPAGISQVTIVAAGAQGGPGQPPYGGVGGGGGSVTATFAVTASTTLSVLVGGQGGTGISMQPAGASGGFNGGGNGGGIDASGTAAGGGGGGGASSVSSGATQLVIAGGGGGAGAGSPNCQAVGAGGYPTGTNAFFVGGYGCPIAGEGAGGLGGTQTTGGAAGPSGGSGMTPGSPGGSGVGGAGGGCVCLGPGVNQGYGGGGGGGGLYGGGGGGSSIETGGGGGGGSSYYASSATNVTTQTGVQTGNGQVVISF